MNEERWKDNQKYKTENTYMNSFIIYCELFLPFLRCVFRICQSLIQGLSQNCVDKRRYSVNRRHRKMKLEPQKLFALKLCVNVKYCAKLNCLNKSILHHKFEMRRNDKSYNEHKTKNIESKNTLRIKKKYWNLFIVLWFTQ